MARPHIEFIQALDVPAKPVADGPLAGTRRRVLSADDGDGSYSSLVTFPDGWTGDLAGLGRSVELFGIDGELEIADKRLGPGCYAYVQPATQPRPLTARGEAHALVMVEPQAPASDEPVEVVDTTSMRFMAPGLDADIPPGIVIKLLRVDAQQGDWTWVAGITPYWQDTRAEIHPTVEEAFLLRGDILLGRRGVMEPGSYFWRPGMVRHGPTFSREGCLAFFRTKGGNLSVTYEDVPDWQQQVAEYVAGDRYFAGNLGGLADITRPLANTPTVLLKDPG